MVLIIKRDSINDPVLRIGLYIITNRQNTNGKEKGKKKIEKEEFFYKMEKEMK